jgi:hypothetical protein
MAWVAVATIGGSLIGAYSSNKASKNAAEAQQQSTQMSIDAQKEATKLDPRIDPLIYGDQGVVNKISGLLDRPQSTGTTQFNNEINTFMRDYGRPEFDNTVRSAHSLMTNNVAAPQISAPNQNSIDLTGSYNSFINGDPGNNPFLTGAIQKGINQSNTAFQNMQTDATRNLTENVLGNIRGGAVAAGQYGGSRQGILEGRALNDFSTQMGRAASQVGQNNTDAAVSAQAGAYNDDRNRALSATSSLGGQQYGLASQNAQLKSQNNQLNAQTQLAGTGMQAGLLNQAYGYQQAGDNADINRMGQVSGLLQPYAGKGSPINVPQQQPIYNNSLSGAIGGATAGLGLYNAFQQPQQSGYNYMDSQVPKNPQYNFNSATPDNYFSYTPKSIVS